ncbi:hypothetical protein [Methanococcus aeolicus]|uniref:hypothetical protein n=1 Tax=Methanococcus aeolicus TaxID=42879 RepID=UPI0021C65CCC|nr:hypothetical protein [Methanococcus aeolicus]UXM84475.1 hypothetical protein N6C89_06970 [Methanococcus aeolicus]
MPYGVGSNNMGGDIMQTATGHFFGYEWDIVIILLVIIIIMLAYLVFKKPSSDIELAKIEKDTAEIKETVKELKKKWDEI